MSKRADRFFDKYCYDCHDETLKKGRVDLENLDFNMGADLTTAEVWQEVLDVVNSGEMPPEDELQPSDQEKADFLQELSYKMVRARKVHAEDGGKITMRRLNRREYRNTMEYVIGVRPDVSALPSDEVEGSFDTQGASLFMSSGQFENYLKAAEDALKRGMKARGPLPKVVRREEAERQHSYEKVKEYHEHYAKLYEGCEKFLKDKAPNSKKAEYGLQRVALPHYQKDGYKNLSKLFGRIIDTPELHDGSILARIMEIQGPMQVVFQSVDLHPSQKVTVRMRGGAFKDVHPDFNYVQLTARDPINHVSKSAGVYKFTADAVNPEIIEIEVDDIDYERLEFRATLRCYQRGATKWSGTKDKPYTPVGVWLDWVEVEVSEVETGFTPQLAEIVYEKPANMSESAYAKDVISKLADRAYRVNRIDPVQHKKLVELFETYRAKGMSVEDALIKPMAVLLSSPSFLYMRETSGGKQTHPRELAVRLAYFLWSSPPDEELLKVADQRKLTNKMVLFKQVERMLADPRAMNFVEGFCHQWLELGRYGIFTFDKEKYPTLDRAVMESAREEVLQTFLYTILRDQPAKALLDADYVIINDVLADYYGLDGIKPGGRFQRVNVSNKEPRGGLLGTAAILGLGSDGTHSSPIMRGAWVLRHLINMSPPPPPPNVPQLDEIKEANLTPKELIEIHQKAPQCHQCHKYIDPVGMGLEQFNAVGLWREEQVVGESQNRIPIDSSGALPFDVPFQDFYGLRQRVAQKEDQFARVLTEELIAYSLGRKFQFVDEELADEIVKASSQRGYILKEIIQRVVLSPQFQAK